MFAEGKKKLRAVLVLLFSGISCLGPSTHKINPKICNCTLKYCFNGTVVVALNLARARTIFFFAVSALYIFWLPSMLHRLNIFVTRCCGQPHLEQTSDVMRGIGRIVMRASIWGCPPHLLTLSKE